MWQLKQTGKAPKTEWWAGDTPSILPRKFIQTLNLIELIRFLVGTLLFRRNEQIARHVLAFRYEDRLLGFPLRARLRPPCAREEPGHGCSAEVALMQRPSISNRGESERQSGRRQTATVSLNSALDHSKTRVCLPVCAVVT